MHIHPFIHPQRGRGRGGGRAKVGLKSRIFKVDSSLQQLHFSLRVTVQKGILHHHKQSSFRLKSPRLFAGKDNMGVFHCRNNAAQMCTETACSDFIHSHQQPPFLPSTISIPSCKNGRLVPALKPTDDQRPVRVSPQKKTAHFALQQFKAGTTCSNRLHKQSANSALSTFVCAPHKVGGDIITTSGFLRVGALNGACWFLQCRNTSWTKQA